MDGQTENILSPSLYSTVERATKLRPCGDVSKVVKLFNNQGSRRQGSSVNPNGDLGVHPEDKAIFCIS